MRAVQQIFFDLEQRGYLSKDSLAGCTEEEIRLVEKSLGCPLPTAYREFLSVAGRFAGKLFVGTDIFYPGILQLDLAAKELFFEAGCLELYPHEAKAFCMHQGYEVLFFIPGSEDPPVLQYVEGNESMTQPWNSFSEFLRDAIAQRYMGIEVDGEKL